MLRKMFKIKLCLFIYLGYFLYTTEAGRKTWKFTNDILNPIHWEGGAESKGCNGFIFPEILGSVGSLFQLETNEVVLPLTGELEIQNGGFIQISNTNKCIRVKEIVPKHWSNPVNWDSDANSATPDVEKIPCAFDDVVFPSQAVAVFYPEAQVSVNSIEFSGVKLTDQQWQNFLDTDYGIEQFQVLVAKSIDIKDQTCTVRSGCTCHRDDEISDWVCDHVKETKAKTCFQPLRPVGFCGDVCGGVMYLDVAAAFSLDVFKTRLPKHDQVDSYASKVMRGGKGAVQVVFVEKSDYTQLSEEEATAFYHTITKDMDRFKVRSARLETSGLSLPKGSAGSTAFGIILGTFGGVLGLFFCIYVLYLGPLKDYDFRSRLPITQFSFGGKLPFFFNKFENDGLSTAASMMSLEKSFDNPMYGAVLPSTSSEIVEIELAEEASTKRKEDLVVIEDLHETYEEN